MLIEFELKGTKGLHKGIFDTHGFWVRFEEEGEHGLDSDGNPVFACDGFKLFSHGSFSFYHADKDICDLVYSRLISVLRGANSVDIENVGYFRKLNK